MPGDKAMKRMAEKRMKQGKCTCWKGYGRVPGTKACTPGSCGKLKRR